MVEGTALPSPIDRTNQPQLLLHAAKHCPVKLWVGSAESVTASFSKLVAGCVPKMNSNTAH